MSSTTHAIKQMVGAVRSDPTLADRLSDTADLIEEVGLDSLELLRLMLEIEARLRIAIDFDKLEFSYLRSIEALATFLDAMPMRPSSAGVA